jgi:hypothetical protein
MEAQTKKITEPAKTTGSVKKRAIVEINKALESIKRGIFLF